MTSISSLGFQDSENDAKEHLEKIANDQMNDNFI